MIVQPGQYPAFPAALFAANPTTPATYVPWFPADKPVSTDVFMTFQPGTIWPSKSVNPAVLSPVSSTATVTDAFPFVMSQACVVCVLAHPQAPPASANCCGNEGSLGRSSCGARRPSISAYAIAGLRRSAAIAAPVRSEETTTTWTPTPLIVRRSRAPTEDSVL